MKFLKEAWLNEDHSDILLTRISDVRFKLQKANQFARENMEKAQSHMKSWYDKKARVRSFKPGEKVMVLLPLHGNPLQAYIVSTPSRRKSKQLCHINMLKPYYDRRNAEASKTAVVVVPVERNSQEGSTSDADLNMEVIRLKNSNILNDLNQKLRHLTSTKGEVIKSLLLEFVRCSLMCQVGLQLLFMMWMWVTQCPLSNMHIESIQLNGSIFVKRLSTCCRMELWNLVKVSGASRVF